MPVRKRRHPLYAIAIPCASLVLALCSGCSTTQTSVTQVWQSPTRLAVPLHSMVVFGTQMDEANRRALEDALVAELAKHDVKALPSYELFPREVPDVAKARAKVKELGVEGILVANLKKFDPKTTYVPAYAGGFWNAYYGPGWQWGSPGYVLTDEVVTFEPMLWDARADDKLVWAALTKTTSPSAGRGFIESLTDAVVPELDRARLIPPRR